MKNKEIWKDINEYEGMYQISNLGRVRSLPRTTTFIDGRKRYFKGQILKQSLSHNGYHNVNLNKSGGNTKRVSRLVAIHFIPNPNNYEEVNHIDEDKSNNKQSNLEWCTPKYNINYGSGINRRAESQWRAVEKVDFNGNIIKKYKSLSHVEKDGYHPSHVRSVIKGLRNHHGGYSWRDLNGN